MPVHAANHRKAKAGERSTTISLRESKAASLWWKKNLTPRKRMIQIVCARLVMRVIVELTTNYRVASIIKQTDQITVKSVFTQESNEECERIINNKQNAPFFCNGGQFLYVRNMHHRIGRSLEIHSFCFVRNICGAVIC